jgi:two-component system, OmpR family, sensor kinase
VALTLRTRLVLSLGVVLVLALVVMAALIVRTTRASLIDQIDTQLETTDVRDLARPGGPHGPDVTGSRLAVVFFSDDGKVLGSIDSGFARDPDPLPAIPTGGATAWKALYGKVTDGQSADGSVRYRMLLQRLVEQPSGFEFNVVMAAPTTSVDEAVVSLVRNLLLVGGAVLAFAIPAGWLLIRRDLRPLDRIAATADSIAGGDLARRANVPHDRTEVGRLSTAFDAMLDRIQASFDSQQAALEAKERSEDRLRRFVGDASHELRTPLTALRGYVDLYRAGGLSDEAALDQAMRRIGTESKRMASLVEDLLLLARLDQGRPLRHEKVDLSLLVEDSVADARAVEPARPISEDIRPGLIVMGDEDRLRQVVGNLFTNVRVHTPVDAGLEVRLSSRDGRAELEVADHGPGISAEHAEQVFDRFYRADPGRSRDRGGSGLGLAIAASVVEAHGGSVVHRPTPGGGATFAVTLPVADPAVPARVA